MGGQISQGAFADENKPAHYEYRIGWSLSTAEYKKDTGLDPLLKAPCD
jgi:hypothetical protein